MRRLPFDRGYPEDQQILFEANKKFIAVMDETKRRFRMPEQGWGDRVGVGSVYAVGRLFKFTGMLSTWNWRWRSDASFPSYLDAVHFSDDPAHMVEGASFAERFAGAVAFAEAANAVFAPDDGEFRARALEMVQASENRPVGIYPGDDTDVAAIDLMLGQANHKVIDRLTRAIWEGNKSSGGSSWVNPEHIELWHQTERLNTARKLLAPDAPLVKLPTMSTTRKKMKAFFEQWHEDLRTGARTLSD